MNAHTAGPGTPLPWRLSEPWGAPNGGYTLEAVNAPGYIADVYAGHHPDDGVDADAGAANGAYIVRACNAHADLLAACEAALTDWHSHPRNFERKEPDYLPMLRAAIAKAEG